MKNTILFISFFAIILLINACKKPGGCTDYNAINYNEFIAPENDNNSCYYHSRYSIYFMETFINNQINKEVIKIEFHYQNQLFPIYDSSEYFSFDSNYNDNYRHLNIDQDLNVKFDTTYFEIKSYISIDSFLSLTGSLEWIGGSNQNKKIK